MYAVSICHGRKLKAKLMRMCNNHIPISLSCILGLIDNHECAVISNNPTHENKISCSMPSLKAAFHPYVNNTCLCFDNDACWYRYTAIFINVLLLFSLA